MTTARKYRYPVSDHAGESVTVELEAGRVNSSPTVTASSGSVTAFAKLSA